MNINQNNPRICLVAGKSAGHILPALTIGQKIKTLDPKAKILFFSNQSPLDYQILNNHPILDQHLALRLIPFPYNKPWQIVSFGWQLLSSIKQCYQVLKAFVPNKIISTGGLVSIPVCLVGKYLGIPIIIYELNVTPGKATKFLSKFADQIYICFSKTADFLPKHKCVLKPYPIRFEPKNYNLTKEQALQIIKSQNINFSPSRKTILILGGSQGSLFINNLMRQFILQKPQIELQIIHQIGGQDQHDWHNFYLHHQIPALVFNYAPNLMPYYIFADVIICRAGAGLLAEITPLKKPCITIPLNTGYTAHQLDNAIAIAKLNPQIKILRQDLIATNFSLFYDLLIKILLD